MPIKIDWIDHRPDITEHRIYRSETTLNIGNLGSPLATVAGNVKTYTDRTVKRGITYNYIVTSVAPDGGEGMSASYYIAYIPDTGPGPKTLKRGDWRFGYFGSLQLSELVSPEELLDAIGMTGVGVIASGAKTNNVWNKVVYNGKILFFPTNTFVNTVSFKDLYDRGLIYGDKQTSQIAPEIINTAGPLKPPKTVVIGQNLFTVRTATSRENPLSTEVTSESQMGGEIDRCMAPLYLNRVNPLPNVPKLLDGQAAETVSITVLTQDYYNGTGANMRVVMRTGDANKGIDTLNANQTRGIYTSTNSTEWRPVLELQVV